jgi:hypothetical protein
LDIITLAVGKKAPRRAERSAADDLGHLAKKPPEPKRRG